MVSKLCGEEGTAGESALVGNVGYGELVIFEQFAGFVNTQLVDVLNRTGVVGFFEFPLELTDGKIGNASELLHADAFSKMFLDIGYDFGHLSQGRLCILFLTTVESTDKGNQQIERRSDDQLPAFFLLGILHADTREDVGGLGHLFWIEVKALLKTIPTFGSGLQVEEGMEAHHFFQLRLASQKLGGIEHDITEIQVLCVAKTVPAVATDNEYIAGLQFVVLDFGYMSGSSSKHKHQLRVLVGVHLEVPVVLNKEDAEAEVFFRHVFLEGAITFLFVQAAVDELMSCSDDFIGNFGWCRHDYSQSLWSRFCQLLCTNNERK